MISGISRGSESGRPARLPPVSFLPYRLPVHPRKLPVVLALRKRGRLVFPALQVGHLLFEFLVAPVSILIQFSCFERFEDRATGLRGVAAVAEAAPCGEFRYFRERLPEVFTRAPQLQFAHAGRVDEKRSARKDDHLTVCRGVPATTVVVADVTHVHAALADQQIEQR